MIGPLPCTKNGNKSVSYFSNSNSLTSAVFISRYIITYIYYYSKWAEAKALPTKESFDVAQFLYSLICRHGVPKKLQSDQGREFVNSVNSHLFKITGVKHIISLAYHPQTNGLIEQFNQTLQRSLLKMVKQNENEWENYLDSVLFAYRTSKQASTKFSPFFLLYGREPRLPNGSNYW